MRIHSLTVENIASLKGRHQVNFDEILLEHKIFAITGDTGAGKSTLLNSISLALYGQNYKNNINQIDYITLGEGQGLVEVEFTISGLRYLARWSCRLKKSSGEYLKNPKTIRELYAYENKQLVPQSFLPEKILHLTFDQFSKTIILNQGQFAKFLTSSFRERKEIIEKLYQGEVLEKLSPTLRSQLNEIKQQLELIESNIQSLNEQSDITIEELNEKLIFFKNKSHAYQGINETSLKLDKSLNEYLHIHKQKELHINKKESLNGEVTEITKSLNEIKKSHFNIEHDLKQLKTQFQQQLPHLQECEKEFHILQQLKASIELLQEQSSKIDTQLSGQKLKKETLENEIQLDHKLIKEKKEHIEYLHKISDLKGIARLFESFKQSRSELAKLSSDRESLQRLLNDYENQGNQLNDQISGLEQQITSKRSTDIKDELEELNKQYNFLQNQFIDLRQFEKNRVQWANKILTYDEQSKSIHLELNKLINELEEHHKQEELYENSIQLFKLQEAIITCQHESLQKGHCVVCSNKNLSEITTPSQQVKPLTEPSEVKDEKYKRFLNDLQTQKNSTRLCETQLHEQKIKVKNIDLHKSELIQNYQKERLEFQAQFNITLPENLSDDLTETILLCEEKLQHLVEKQDELKKILHQVDLSKIDLDKCIASRNEFRKKYTDVKQEWKELSTKIELQQQQLNELEKNFIVFLPNVNLQDDHIISQISKDIAILQEVLTITNVVNQKDISFNELITSISNNQSESINLQKVIESKLQEAKRIQTKLSSEFDDKDPTFIINQKRELIEEKAIHYEKSQNQLKGYQLQITELESRLKSSIEQINQSEILLEQLWPSITILASSQEKLIQDSQYNLFSQVNDSQKKIVFFNELANAKRCLEAALIHFLIQENSRFQKEFYQIQSDSKQSMTRFKTLLEQRQKIEHKVLEHKEKMKKLNSIKLRKESLYELVGKDEFRNFVLSLIEKDLIYQTNLELETLCEGRYQLLHFHKNNMSPDFYVIDKMKEGLTRKVSTLSGGETFMVSLAMALALAEMTRGQSEIDSFFIDEGFGTLDEDSLEDILDMLQNLHVRGKQIGIISHIKSLTKRINTNIHLTKGQYGSSSIGIIYN